MAKTGSGLINIQADMIETTSLNVNDVDFKLEKGTWVPVLRHIQTAGVTIPVATINYDYQYGNFVRSGDSVTVSFDLKFSITSTDGAIKFLAIGGLPKKIGLKNAIGINAVTAPATIAEFPNGIAAGGLIPAPLLPTYPGNVQFEAYEEGEQIPLNFVEIIIIPGGTWTSDGRHLVISGDCTNYGVDLEPPFYFEIQSKKATISSYWFLPNITYNDCRFQGSITYLTDDM